MHLPRWTVVPCLVLALAPCSVLAAPIGEAPGNLNLGSAGGTLAPQPEPDPLPRDIATDPEIFRAQLLRLFEEIEAVTELGLQLAIPAPNPSTSSDGPGSSASVVHLNQVDLRLERVRDDVLALSDDELEAVREGLEQLPDLLVLPLQLEASLTGSAEQVNGGTAEDCPGGENVDEFIFVTKLIKISLLGIAHPIETLANIAQASPADATHLTAAASVPLFIAKLVLELLGDATEIVVTVAERTRERRMECLSGLCQPDPDPLGSGKGCDGVDTDCDDPETVDEETEDQFDPTVTIDRNVGNRCYASAAAASAAVQRFTRASDDCGFAQASDPETELEGCDLIATVGVTDDSGNASSDAVHLVVDGIAPVVTCAVATPFLTPANNTMRDVGLSVLVNDNCGGTPELRLEVTSDEPTSTAVTGVDLSPDAVILYDAEQRPNGLLLRAQRNGAVGSTGGGRVYRVRAIATDACGLTSQSDCLVTVGISPNATTAVNSGQHFDATTVN